MQSLDWVLFHWLNTHAGDYFWLDHLAKFAATQLAIVIVGTLIGGWLFAAVRHFWPERLFPRGLLTVVLAVFAAMVLGLAVNRLITSLWYRPRPFVTHSKAHLLTPHAADASFPSDHATAGFAITFGVAPELPRLAILLLLETLVLGVSRVFVGLHYPGDILGSLAVAAVSSAAVWVMVNRAAALTDAAAGSFNGFAEQRGWRTRVG